MIPPPPGCLFQRGRRNIRNRARTPTTSWVKRLPCWPHNRVHPNGGSTEELPEDQREAVPSSTLEQEALPSSGVSEAVIDHAQQEDLLEEQPQAGAEEPPQPTLKAAAEATEPASREDQLVEHLQAGAEEPPMPTGKAVGALKEHGFREDLPVNLLCDNTEESACFSKVAPSGCESDCFLESVSSSDAEENTATPDACCPQRPESCMAHIEDLEESKPVEIPKRSLVIFLKIPTGEVSSDDEEDLEEQE
ncbi:uncharacterized protein LOC129544165 isoform X2 [Moschus berezovskii]|uniref:uncharacterized protein LOC129544165 isoform X2 n=1 Tax=Moschus berezovskii TaxID=68408 RepID=UPI002445353A|nr:uncharacterized protein LOC129544165 isoform X2 [Moschus berezovskii]